MENKDLFAPPTKQELDMFAPPTEQELISLGLAQKEPSISESLEQSASDIARGLGSGLLMGGLEEATAGLKAITSSEKDDLANLYRKYLEIEEKKAAEAKERSPVLTGVGEFAGAMLPGLASGGITLGLSGGKAAAQLGGRELLKAAGMGALGGAATGAAGGAISGALTSEEGKLIGATEEEKQQLLEDVKSGAKFGGLFGGVLGGGAPLVGKLGSMAKSKVDEILEDTILGRQAKYVAKASEEGKGFQTYPERQAREAEISTDVDRLYDWFTGIERSAANEFKNPIRAAKEVGDLVELKSPIDPETGSSQAANLFRKFGLDEIANELDTAASDGIDAYSAYELRKSLKEAATKTKDLSPFVDTLVKEIDDGIENVVQSPKVQNYLKESNQSTSYKKGLETYSKTMRATTEAITEKGRPIKARGKYFHDLAYEEKTLHDTLKSLVDELTHPGTTSSEAIRSIYGKEGGLKELLTKLSQENPEEMARVAKGLGYDSIEKLRDDLINQIEKTSIQSTSLRAITGERAGEKGLPKGLIGEVTSLGRTGTLTGVSGYGKAVGAVKRFGQKQPVKTAKMIYNLPETGLRNIADRLSKNPKLEKYAKNLQNALDSGDTIKKNAVLFALSQNPEIRDAINSMVGIEGEEE